jgi:hypothetical protein
MSSKAVQVENVVSKAKDYDITWTPQGGEPKVLEYTQWMLPGKSEASSYNLVTNLRNIEESAGDGTFNTLTIGVPVSIAAYKEWLEDYDKAGTLKIASTIEGQEDLAITFNVRINTIGDFTGALDSINAVDLGFKVLSVAD